MIELNKIYCEDALIGLKKLPDNYVNCCVTSPPYYGLRDYGTAKWEGGDLECNHKTAKIKTRYDYSLKNSKIQDGTRSGTDGGQYKKICPDCGATNIDKQLGLEENPELYVEKLVKIFREVKRVLKKDGTLWIVIGDTYWSSGGASRHHGYTDPKYENGRKVEYFEPQCYPHKFIKPKDLIGIPWMVAFALRADGWYLRQDIIWSKPNPMPESVMDRCTKSHEYIFLLSKSAKYYYDYKAIAEKSEWFDRDNRSKTGYTQSGIGLGIYGCDKQGVYNDDGTRNKRSVWTVTTKGYSEAHFAVYPQKLIEDCIKAGCPENGIVLDPFAGANTTGIVARKQNKNFIGFELNPDYIKMAEKRMYEELGMFI